MTPENRRRAIDLFAQAEELAPEIRAAFVAEACGPDRELRSEVESLLSSGRQAHDFLEVPALGDAATWPEPGGELAGLRPGEMVAGRYQIVRALGAGGMGEVYEAEDQELRLKVALKTIKPGIAREEKIIERFKREISLTRTISHPNVCRIFDFGRCRRSDSGTETFFLTMELLSGETLAERLRQKDRFTREEALPIVAQVVSGLMAAHRAGIVHRDLKSGNIFLVEAPNGEGARRAVVTDFGLARAVATSGSSGGSAEASLTHAGDLLGSPAYMAPEQVEGGPVTPAVDVYALGVVLYEMVTRQRPFTGDSPLAVAMARLKNPPLSPRVHAPDLDPRWERAILRALERDSSDRFASAEDLLAALRGERVPPSPKQRLRSRRWFAGTAAAVLFVAAAVLLWPKLLATLRLPARPVPSVTRRPRRSIAILGFANLAGRPESAWLSTAFSQMFSTELAAGGKLRVIPQENISRVRTDLGLANLESLGGESLARIRASLGADYVASGSYTDLPERREGKIRFDIHLQDTQTGETVAAVAETGPESGLFDLVSHAGSGLREKLKVEALTPAEEQGVRASVPPSSDAARFYSDGLDKLRIFEALPARDLLERAVDAAPNYPMAHSALAEAWTALGYDERAREEAKAAFDLSGGLPREDRLLVEARYREALKNWSRAAEIYRGLWDFFPDNVEYGLRLASVQIPLRPKDALATAEDLKRLSAPVSEDPRIDLTEALAADALSDFRRELDASERAARKANIRGARLLEASADIQRGKAAWALGRPSEAVADYEEARKRFLVAGDRGGVVRALGAIANVAYLQGRFADASSLYEECLSVYRSIGNELGVGNTLNSMAVIAADQRDIERAKRLHEEALPHFRTAGNRFGAAGASGNIANLLQYEGDLEGARKLHEEALETFRELGDQNAMAIEMNNTGILLWMGGDLSAARRLHEEALAIRKAMGHRAFIASSLFNIGDVLMSQDDLAQARQKYEEAAAIRSDLRMGVRAAESLVALAAVSFEEEEWARSLEQARSAAETFRREKVRDSEGQAWLAAARPLIRLGRRDEAREALSRASNLLSATQDHVAQLSFRIDSARVWGESGGVAEAREAAQGLRNALVEAVRIRDVLLEFEARLALGQLEMRLGDNAAGRARLLALERDARARGYKLISRKAANAIRASSAPKEGVRFLAVWPLKSLAQLPVEW